MVNSIHFSSGTSNPPFRPHAGLLPVAGPLYDIDSTLGKSMLSRLVELLDEETRLVKVYIIESAGDSGEMRLLSDVLRRFAHR